MVGVAVIEVKVRENRLKMLWQVQQRPLDVTMRSNDRILLMEMLGVRKELIWYLAIKMNVKCG